MRRSAVVGRRNLCGAATCCAMVSASGGTQTIQRIKDYVGDLTGVTAAELASLDHPVVLRGIAADWPIVRSLDAAAYLRRFTSTAKTQVSLAAPKHKGRLFYTDGMADLTFTNE